MVELEKVNLQRSLCQKYDRKCLTSIYGRCPLAAFNCFDYLSFREFYGNINTRTRKKVDAVLHDAAAAAGYKLQDFEHGTKLL